MYLFLLPRQYQQVQVAHHRMVPAEVRTSITARVLLLDLAVPPATSVARHLATVKLVVNRPLELAPLEQVISQQMDRAVPTEKLALAPALELVAVLTATVATQPATVLPAASKCCRQTPYIAKAPR